ncbi:MFS transporter [Nocardia sp. NPDC049220]|uniref:MFS transporter n=1 Tax=Nocardia sp. NPDC049220 TaxID=3155273 RepID=UPI0033D588F0
MSRSSAEGQRPAGYWDLLVLVEYRAVLTASALSWAGDYLCKAAVALQVFDRTGSVLASASAFAVGYLPWLTAGPLFAAVAERYPTRSVMISCDFVRAVLIGLIAIPGVPVSVLLVLLFTSGLLAPPFEAARSALLPHLLTGDRYPVGMALNNTVFHLAQVLGYAAGGVIAGYSSHTALLLNAGTFVASAFLLRRYVELRPAALAATRRSGLWSETRQGYVLVFGDPVMRAIAFIVFATVTFVVVPEGLAAAWASEIDGGGATQGLIMVANPVGFAIGGLIPTRLARLRTRLVRPLAVLAPLTLVPALLDPPLTGILALVTASGVVMSLLLPAAQTLFRTVLPDEYRARAFGVMNSGIQIAQGAAILATGAASEPFPTAMVIGTWCATGVLVMLLVSSQSFTRPEPSALSPDSTERTP